MAEVYYEFDMVELTEMKGYLQQLEDEIENIKDLDLSGDNNEGKYGSAVFSTLDDQKNYATTIVGKINDVIAYIDFVTIHIDENGKPLYPDDIIRFYPERLNDALETISNMLDYNISDIIENSSSYESWVNSTIETINNVKIGNGWFGGEQENFDEDQAAIDEFYNNTVKITELNDSLKREIGYLNDTFFKLEKHEEALKEFSEVFEMLQPIEDLFLDNRHYSNDVTTEVNENDFPDSEFDYTDKDGVEYNFEEKYYEFTIDGKTYKVMIGSDHQLRVYVDNIYSYEECKAIVHEVCDALRNLYPEYSDLSDYEICMKEYGATPENVAAEIWGHAEAYHDDNPIGNNHANPADINGHENMSATEDDRHTGKITTENGGHMEWYGNDDPEDPEDGLSHHQ